MSDYISREDALAESFTVQTKEYGSVEVVSVEQLASIPSADVAPVVRCADCKYNHMPKDHTENPDITCSYWMSDGLSLNDFCSNGERREQDG